MSWIPKWRRPRFSLRALLVAVAVLSIWLGWEANAIRERRKTAEWIEAKGGFLGEGSIGYDLRGIAEISFGALPSEPTIPRLRRFMGDTPYPCLTLPEIATREQCEDVARLFPEAVIVQHRWPEANP